MRNLTATILLSFALVPPIAASAQPTTDANVMLVVDASGSMAGRIGGRSKIEIARAAVSDLLSTWPSSHQLGLVAYGHRRKGDCADIETLVPHGPVDMAAFRARVDALEPRGMTPIVAAVRSAAEALRWSEQRATVILVSDGEETCGADPCELGAELEQAGIDFTAHVVGFDLPEGPARAQLACLAERTGGQYIEAADAASLSDALGTLAAAPEARAPAVRTGEAWIPGYALEWSGDVFADDGGATRAIEFEVSQDARACQALCDADTGCGGWHYEPAGSFFIDYPRCHLKGRGAAMQLIEQGEGWVAGIKPGVALIRGEE
jgi:Ca-activated chloride channel family protein